MTLSDISARRIHIKGVVQGVGFRPFLYNLACDRKLAGRVANTASGVDLQVEGAACDLELFIRDIPLKKPLLSRITAIEAYDEPVRGFTGFEIVKSGNSGQRFTLISPDVSVCPDCLAEMIDPCDRRFEYPFINCTNCGPRYTIIEDIPYDRPKTSMKQFVMCPDCQAEYDNPCDRRFHAQPNACPVCGPGISLVDSHGKRLDRNPGHALDLAAQFLSQGKIVAVKGLGGFHLACDAANETAVSLLRHRKKRPHKPFALMAASDNGLFDHVHVSEQEQELVNSFHRPIVLFTKKEWPHGKSGGRDPILAPSIAPYNSCLGIMLPYTPLHYLLLAKGPKILVMTSGNRAGEPLSIDNGDALDAFGDIADVFLLHNRDIYFRADDSIARVQEGETRFLRRSRGYAPLPVDLVPFDKERLPMILGCGAGMKSTICLTRDRYAFLSQHIGDLASVNVQAFYTQTIDHMQHILDIEPEVAVHDPHPGYFSTTYAKTLEQQGVPLIPVYHHHAHALSCMAENHLDGEVLALTLDGTGLGTDGNIWGGELLSCTYGGFKRHGRLSYLPMPGGDAAVLEPWRMAASLLYKVYGPDFLDLDIQGVRAMDAKKLEFIVQMMDRQVNCPLTSSAGRLCDAASSINNVRHFISHDSQAAMEFEAQADREDSGTAYEFELKKDNSGYLVIDPGPMVRQMVSDILAGVPTAAISARFHGGLVDGFARACVQAGKSTGLSRVVLSGGVFNNDIIFCRTVDRLKKNGFEVYTHSRVPCGDGGIALGQVMAAAARLSGTLNN